MAETGVLQPDACVELLEGTVVDKSKISPFRAFVRSKFGEIFIRQCNDRCITSVSNPVRLDEYSEPEPDVALLLPRDDFYGLAHPGPEEVCLLIEVSDTTLDADREVKLPLYGRAGIPEVWLINLIDLTVEVYREPNFNGYSSKTILRSGDNASPLAFPDIAVNVAQLLER